ncbi:MAG TPA: lysophospholipid acyltransferase family protein [Gemmatimonadaceae bacterium]|nr:lysophospholipid acyltransferase family protein [Gemmatimonadaceae bacterium]
MRTALVALALVFLTIPIGLIVLLAALLRVPDSPSGVYQWAMRTWARGVCRAAGVRIVLHNPERIRRDGPAVYVANHVSWFDIFALASVLPRYTFVAKSELQKIVLFGPAAKAAGIVFIERSNRRAAFDSYREAATMVRGGKSVVVCPEGTRGRDYHLRPFKKGPFVFAISSGAPIIPTVVHGTIHIQRKGSFRVRSGTVHIHFLEQVPTEGISYEDRAQLMETVWRRMADFLRDEYHVGTNEYPIAGEGDRPERETSFF